MKSLIDTDMLRLAGRFHEGEAACPPHAVMETAQHYSIFLNLLGIAREDIAFALNEGTRELTVLAKRERERMRTGLFWMFSLPKEGALSEIRMRYRNGAVEIRIPKMAA